MRSGKRAIRTAQRSNCSTGFVVSYEAGQDFAFPEDFDLSRYSLLLCESIRSSQSTTILLYWASEERANAQQPLAEKALGVTTPRTIGPVVEVRTPKAPKWIENPVRWGKWIVSAAALFGALSVIRDNFTSLFARPHVVLFASNAASADYHLGDAFDIPIVVRNEASLGAADVHLRSIDLKPLTPGSAAQPLHFDISQVPQLQAGQNVEVHTSGFARAGASHQQAPEKYSLEIEAQAEEGWFWRWRPVTYRPYTVSFWPDRAWTSNVVQTSPQTAQVQITLCSGRSYPNGIHGQLAFASAVPPESDGIALISASPFSGGKNIGAPIIVRHPDNSVAKIEFLTDPLQAFHGYSFAVSIAFQRALSAPEWSALRSSIAVRFE